MQASVPLINAIVNNVLLHSNSPHQTDAASNHSHPALLVVDLVPQILKRNQSIINQVYYFSSTLQSKFHN